MKWFGFWLSIVVCLRIGYCTIHEVEPGMSIQNAANACMSGDTILVHDGTFQETVVLYGKAVVIGSRFLLDGDTCHIGATIITPGFEREDTTSCFVYSYTEPPGNRLVGLTLQSGQGTRFFEEDAPAGGCIFARSVNVAVEHCKVVGGTADYGGGIFAYGSRHFTGPPMLVSDCEIQSCFSDRWGGGIYAAFCSLSVHRARITDNLSLASGGGLSCGDCVVELDSCRFLRNRGGTGGVLVGGERGMIENCIFDSNASVGTLGSAHLLVFDGTFRIAGNSFYPSMSNTLPIEFCCNPQDTVYFLHNLVEGNISVYEHSGCILVGGVAGEIAHNIFRQNVNHGIGVLYCYQGTRVRIHHNVFTANENLDPDRGTVMLTGPDSHESFDSNLVSGNLGQTFTALAGYPHDFRLENNWWGDASGPFHPALNPGGIGDTVLISSVVIEPWLTLPPDTTFGIIPEHGADLIPATWKIAAAYPNPFNGSFSVQIEGATGSDFAVLLYNTNGQLVARIHRGLLRDAALRYQPPDHLAAGVYLLVARERGRTATQKVLYLK